MCPGLKRMAKLCQHTLFSMPKASVGHCIEADMPFSMLLLVRTDMSKDTLHIK